MTNQITCITKPNRDSSHEAIQFVGGVNGEGGRFKISREQCYDYIKQGYTFFVKVDNSRINVEAYQRSGQGKYIKTYPDATKKDNLLSLPPCT